jgi:hypothetical protein
VVRTHPMSFFVCVKNVGHLMVSPEISYDSYGQSSINTKRRCTVLINSGLMRTQKCLGLMRTQKCLGHTDTVPRMCNVAKAISTAASIIDQSNSFTSKNSTKD